VSLAYPVGDVLLLALAARLATSPGRRPVAFRLLIASLAAMFAADMAFSVLDLPLEGQRLRELMMSLRPPALDEVGLEAALRDQVGAFIRHSGVDCEVRVDLARRLGGELETIVYRVAQAKRLWLEGQGTGCTCASATTGSASPRWAAPSWSATATSAWWRCASGSSWPGGRFQLESRPGAGVVVKVSFDLPSAA
jgi:hypothetical protein